MIVFLSDWTTSHLLCYKLMINLVIHMFANPVFLHRRNTCGIILTALWLSLLAGCSQPPPATRTPTPPGPTRAPSLQQRPSQTPTRTLTPAVIPTSGFDLEEEELEGLSITFWHPWSAPLSEVMADLVSEFNLQNEWEVHVEIWNSSSYDLLDQAIKSIADPEDRPNLIIAYPYQLAGPSGITLPLVEIEPYLDDPLWGFTEMDRKAFYPAFWPAGKPSGFPAQRDGQFLYYNRTWAQELGYETPPKTIEELQDQACSAARAYQADDDPSNNGRGGLILTTDYPTFLGWLAAFEASPLSPVGGRYQFNTPETQAALEFVRALYDQGCAWLAENNPPENEFASRQGLFTSGSLTSIPYQEDWFADLGSRDEWTVLAFPGYMSGEAAVPVYGPDFMIIAARGPEQLASWLLVRWLNEPAQQARLVRASYSYPLREDLQPVLNPDQNMLLQWNNAALMIEYAQMEPQLPSWGVVRWTVSDVATQLFRWYYEPNQLPDTLRLWDRTAQELQEISP